MSQHRIEDASVIPQTAAELKFQKDTKIIVEALRKDADVDVNATDENGNTALHLAVKYSLIPTVELLLKSGANLEAKNGAEVTPLHIAAFNPTSSAIFELLLEKGADLYAVDRDGNTVLHVAAASNNISVIEKIAAENPAFHKIRNRLGNTPLHVAACFNHQHTINKLLDLGADPNVSNSYQQIPLDIATQWVSDMAKQILAAKTEPYLYHSSPDRGYQTLKRSPTGIYRRTNIVLENILNRHKQGDPNLGLLHQAIAFSSDILPIYKWLNLRHQYNKNMEDKLKEKDFSNSYYYFDFDKLSTDIRNKINSDPYLNKNEMVSEDFSGAITTLKYALALEVGIWSDVALPTVNLSVDNLLYLADKDHLKPIIEPVLCEFAAPEKLIQLLDSGIDINEQDEFGSTPLHVAAYFGYSHIVELLLARGANPNLENKQGKTPLEVAEEENHTQVLDVLQKRFNPDLLKKLEVIKSFTTTEVNRISLKNIEKTLLAKRSSAQAFIDWVDENPQWSIVIAFFGSVLLLVPTISIIVAALSHSSKKPVKNFIKEFAVAAINGELNTCNNTSLFSASKNLPPQIKDVANNLIGDWLKKQKTVIDKQETLVKEIFLQILEDAPASFLWNKKQLADLLRVEQKENGDFLLVFKQTYESTKEFYLTTQEKQYQYEAEVFVNFVRAVFEAPVIKIEKDISSGSMIETKGKCFTCSVNVMDICTRVNKQALQSYYQSFEVLAKFKAAIQGWAEQAEQNEENTLLAKSISDNLKVTINQNKEIAICSEVMEGIIHVWLDSSGSGEGIKAQKLKQKSESYNNSIAHLKSHLTQIFGEKAFNLTSKCVIDVGTFDQETRLTVPQERFQTIVEMKEELPPELQVFDLFLKSKEKSEKDSHKMGPTTHENTKKGLF